MKLLTTTALMLTLSLPAQATTWDYYFNTWAVDNYNVIGTGTITSDDRAVGMPVLVTAQWTQLTIWLAPWYSTLQPPQPQYSSSQNITILSAQWIPGTILFSPTRDNFLPGLLFETPGYGTMRRSFTVYDGQMTLTLAAPGPVASASLPALALGWLGLWGYRRRQRA